MMSAIVQGPFLTILIQLSLFALGTSLGAIALLVWRRPKRWYWYAMTKVGIFLTIGAVFVTILLPAGRIEPTREAITYAVGLGFVGVGLIGVCRDIAKKLGATPHRGVSLMHREHDRLALLEGRLSTEELRNDRLEERADEHGTSRPDEHDH